MGSIKEAKDRVLEQRQRLHDEAVVEYNKKMSDLHNGVTEFIAAMNETYPNGIQVDPNAVFSDTCVLDQWVSGLFRYEYEKRQGVSTAIMLLSADRNGEPGITLALVNLNRPQSSKDWIITSADLRTVQEGIGFHIHNLRITDPDVLSNQSLIEGQIAAAKANSDPLELTKTLVEYAEPMLDFAADVYQKTVYAEIAKSTPRRRGGGVGSA